MSTPEVAISNVVVVSCKESGFNLSCYWSDAPSELGGDASRLPASSFSFSFPSSPASACMLLRSLGQEILPQTAQSPRDKTHTSWPLTRRRCGLHSASWREQAKTVTRLRVTTTSLVALLKEMSKAGEVNQRKLRKKTITYNSHHNDNNILRRTSETMSVCHSICLPSRASIAGHSVQWNGIERQSGR